MTENRLLGMLKSTAAFRIWLSLAGTIFNVLLAFIAHRYSLPVYLDTIGTFAVAAIGGLFPGILTAVATNTLCALFNINAIYYGFLNAAMAIFVVWYARKYSFKKFYTLLYLIIPAGLFSGSISAVINWFILDGATVAKNSETVRLFVSTTGMLYFWAYFIYSILLNLIDKGISIIVASLLLWIIPESKLDEIERGNWKQTPLSQEDIEELKGFGKEANIPMRTKTTLTILSTSLLLVIVTGWVGIRMYYNNQKEEKTKDALSSLRLASDVLNADLVSDYISYGEGAIGYTYTENLIKSINESFHSVEYLYIVKIGKDEGRLVFNLGPAGYSSDDKTKKIQYDESVVPYLDQLLSGENIKPIEHESLGTWMRSVYLPIFDKEGNCVCYAVADVSINDMAGDVSKFSIKTIIILLGFFILVIAHDLWVTNVTLVYPVRSMARCVEDFSNRGYEQEQLDNNVRNIRALDIHTHDELEKLYNSICNMTLNLSEQMRDLRRLSDITAKMQDGLIITMADMVENRDSDTGAHIQKTAAYVKIIVEGLQKKGYYAEKITPKFISDVVRSAPLHDIGKINISDGILNKPGKLTDEEYEIMKTHTTAGKKIMEDAISTVKGENYLKEARNMAAYHHERWDGKGYPEGLHGEVIPLSARIMAVADVFDALTSKRVYKPAYPIEEALDILREGAGTQFDPKCLEVFMDSIPEIRVIVRKYNKD